MPPALELDRAAIGRNGKTAPLDGLGAMYLTVDVRLRDGIAIDLDERVLVVLLHIGGEAGGVSLKFSHCTHSLSY